MVKEFGKSGHLEKIMRKSLVSPYFSDVMANGVVLVPPCSCSRIVSAAYFKPSAHYNKINQILFDAFILHVQAF